MALAALNYESSANTLPAANYWVLTPGTTTHLYGPSVFVTMSQYLEQGQAYSEMNFSLTYEDPTNLTVAGIGISTLWCPSDPSVSQCAIIAEFYGLASSGPWKQQFTSYAGCEGTWAIYVGTDDGPGVLPSWLVTANGLIFTQAATRRALITDGTSNTMMLGERRGTAFSAVRMRLVLQLELRLLGRHILRYDLPHQCLSETFRHARPQRSHEPIRRLVVGSHTVGIELPSGRGELRLRRRLGEFY